MAGFTDRVSRGILGHIVGKTAIFALPQCYIGLFTGVGVDAGSGFAEVSGGGYARVATTGADWSAPGGSAPSTVNNANSIVFPTSSANWGTVIAFGLYDAVTAGNLMAWDFFGNCDWAPVTISAGTPGIFTQKAHGYLAGDSVIYTTEFGGVNPGGAVIAGTIMTVASPTVDSYNVGINTSTTGSGMVRKMSPQLIVSGVQPTFAPASLTISSS